MKKDKKRILIITASPQRDKLIDEILRAALEDLGNEVFMEPMLPIITKKIVDIEPDILVMPPIRNTYTFNFAKNAIKWGIGVVIRHVEPGCDEKDLEYMGEMWERGVVYDRPAGISLELVWGNPEVEYIKKLRGLSTLTLSVGAFVADIYKNPDIIQQISDKPAFCERYGLDAAKETVLISSPWGLLDIESDRLGQTTRAMLSDKKAKSAWLAMVTELAEKIGGSRNILTTLHPGLQADVELMTQLSHLKIPIDVSATATGLLVNSDILIHAGSTMAVEMHWLGKPSFQFGDVNTLDLPDGNWWQHADTAISRVSPFFTSPQKLSEAVINCDGKDNANIKVIEELEAGRYGCMDGQATRRSAELINLVDGEYKVAWPVLPPIMISPCFLEKFENAYTKILCGMCNNIFWFMRKEYIDLIAREHPEIKQRIHPALFLCPNCGRSFNKRIKGR